MAYFAVENDKELSNLFTSKRAAEEYKALHGGVIRAFLTCNEYKLCKDENKKSETKDVTISRIPVRERIIENYGR